MGNAVIISSYPHFHRKIITRYQISTRSYLRFPIMIFYRNMGRLLSQEFIVNAILRPHFHNINVAYSFIGKRVQEIKQMFSWFRTEKLNQITNNFKHGNPMHIKTSVISFQANLLPNKNVMLFINKVGMYPQVKEQFLNKGHMQITAPQVQIISNNFNRGNLIQSKSSLVSFQANLLPNKNVLPIIHRPSGIKYHVNSGFDSANSKVIIREPVINVQSGDLYFRSQRKIEQEVDEIRKIVIQTKESMIERSQNRSPVDINMKQRLDINRISDQVYQNIERKIRVEKERRGF